MSFGSDEVIFLLGAGASVDASIPSSYKMIMDIEYFIETQDEWKELKKLYYFLKSAIAFSEGIKGSGDEAQYNIEILLITIEELLKRDTHPLFPFIGSWTPMLPEVAKDDFSRVLKLKKLIVNNLKKWIKPKHHDVFDYYRGLFRFQETSEFPLRIFSLNYDLAIEITGWGSSNYFSRKRCVERGFDKKSHKWNWQVLADEPNDVDIFLYKLHGSIDWIREADGELIACDNLQDDEENEIIFGTAYKMQYADPFLFFAYEFRKRTLTDAKVIFCVGYSFSDDHVNKILQQAIKADSSRKIVSVGPCGFAGDEEEKEKIRIRSRLNIDENCSNQIIILNETAKNFFERLTVEIVEGYIDRDDADIPFAPPQA